ncbi:hypothetical protein AVEN_236391-1 [Araneus ventricosus]|uniref:IGFBP N-terminal domain-containing protein n=1 Tax=Araneus ventricosus TaxID=182803 RepID=A0A4Y2LWU1_ARAVE|nr:hypothetical protein AVEN_236391-1 [Araneus ventricosus]
MCVPSVRVLTEEQEECVQSVRNLTLKIDSSIFAMYQILFLLLTAVVAANAIVCTPEICESQKPCPQVQCEEGQTLVENGSSCECCPACITFLGKGEKCPSSHVRGGPPPTTKCEDGLSCLENEDHEYVCTCTCDN